MTDRYLTVTALTRYMKRKIDIDPHLKNVWLKGEISNFNHHSRGHMYFTIKDDQTRIQAVMFAGNNRRLRFTPEDGMHVLVKGEVSLFEAYGQYQLYVQQMEPDGVGSLYLAFEQLKAQLEKQGFFDKNRKKPIPLFPKHIGIITSPTGAAIRDIITTISRRYPIVKTTVIPTIVQGAMAADSISHAIKRANDMGLFDVLIVGRGGGSIEDLWGFNEKIVAEAIFYSDTPIISAVGHETDITISDFVADLRAPTPTGAAELAVPSQTELLTKLSGYKKSLTRLLRNTLMNEEQHLQRLRQSYAFRYPMNLLKQKEQELDTLTAQLEKSQMGILKSQQEKMAHLNTRLINQHPSRQYEQASKELKQLTVNVKQSFSQIMDRKTIQLSMAIDKLTLLNPLEIMKRGFAIPYTPKGNIITSSKQLQKNDTMLVTFRDGTVNCQVLNVEENHND